MCKNANISRLPVVECMIAGGPDCYVRIMCSTTGLPEGLIHWLYSRQNALSAVNECESEEHHMWSSSRCGENSACRCSTRLRAACQQAVSLMQTNVPVWEAVVVGLAQLHVSRLGPKLYPEASRRCVSTMCRAIHSTRARCAVTWVCKAPHVHCKMLQNATRRLRSGK